MHKLKNLFIYTRAISKPVYGWSISKGWAKIMGGEASCRALMTHSMATGESESREREREREREKEKRENAMGDMVNKEY